MLFRRRQKPAPTTASITDPVIDARIHWLASRGLMVRDGITVEEWIGAADDPTDPVSLAGAQMNGEPCVQPHPMVSISGTDLQMVHDLADGLELPIDEVEVSGGDLRIRSASTHLTFPLGGQDLLEVLRDVAAEFVDSAHVLLKRGSTFAIVHRDIAAQAEAALHALPQE